jgi:hypothetical protein
VIVAGRGGGSVRTDETDVVQRCIVGFLNTNNWFRVATEERPGTTVGDIFCRLGVGVGGFSAAFLLLFLVAHPFGCWVVRNKEETRFRTTA